MFTQYICIFIIVEGEQHCAGADSGSSGMDAAQLLSQGPALSVIWTDEKVIIVRGPFFSLSSLLSKAHLAIHAATARLW